MELVQASDQKEQPKQRDEKTNFFIKQYLIF